MASGIGQAYLQAQIRDRIAVLLGQITDAGIEDLPTLKTHPDALVQQTYFLEYVEGCLAVLADQVSAPARKPRRAKAA
jgi:hypothetical protein